MNREMDRTMASAKVYRQACIDGASSSHVTLYDCWTAFDPNNLSEYLLDGLHFNEKGNRAFFDGLVKVIPEHLLPSNLPFGLPEWRDIKDNKVF
jgi:lysophospholipase L1-like esterase